ncbi:hypothetical protein [Tumebacillus flagellatus]|uniref:Uncharacterized protein n=1 Tax=Tumebacillus flagellatus TaxID=1157490 RepID=A0A074M8Z8_9BACL|nr:hypothetical protein [Tumebacillus flagellatus]KEO82437.1 hypothetical protein EL26_15270 [Tumebacillus flagellatus]
MKKIYLIFATLAVCLAVGGIVFWQVFSKPAMTTEHDISGFTKSDTKFDSPDPQSPPAFDIKAAYNRAIKMYPQAAKECSSVNVDYQLVTTTSMEAFSPEALEKNPKLKADGHMIKTPAYLVTFNGIYDEGHGGIGAPPPVFTKLTILLDANSGEELFGVEHN